MKEFHQLIKEICLEEEVVCSVLSKEWIVMLEKERKIRFISGYKFDLNGHGFGNVIDDKYATFEVLQEKLIPVTIHKILFNQVNQNDYAKESNTYHIVEQFFWEHDQNIVLKANDSTCGNEVYHITEYQNISTCLDKLFKKNFSISICPLYSIKSEYRFIILKNECILMYGKKRPIVVGDGKKTIRELLVDFNTYYFCDKLIEDEYTRVLAKNEVYEYSWQFNLSKGSIPFEISDIALKERLLNFIKSITDVLDIGFASIDVIETVQGELLVMELNSGIMMKNYMQLMPNGCCIAKKIYKKAIQEMFNT